MKLVLVVCTGNICRSPMGEALLTQALLRSALQGWAVESRGVRAVVGHPATREALRAARELGLDLREHRGQQITAEDIADAKLILTMERWQRDWIRPHAGDWPGKVQLWTHHDELADREIDDPYGEPIEVFRECLAELGRSTEGLIKAMRAIPPEAAGA